MAGPDADVIVVGAGAAGLATAIFTGRGRPGMRILVLDGVRRPGAKILVSGGSRCNVTNTVVTEGDFNGGRPPIIRRILRGLPVVDTVEFFRQIGVPLHEEPGGKLFPDSNRSRDVLQALLGATYRAGATLLAEHRVTAIDRTPDGFHLTTSRGPFHASRVVLATGGQSLPKSGSDGAGYGFARALGHSIVPPTPALVPLLLDGAAGSVHRDLSGVSHEALLELWVNGARSTQVRGALLWTHFGLSGPAALDASRHWLRAVLEKREVRLSARLVPDQTFEEMDRWWIAAALDRPRTTVQSALGSVLPVSVAQAVLGRLAIGADMPLARLTREERRTIAHALTAWPLPVSDSRGYNFAEATAGGVTLSEVDPGTMESRLCPGLFLVGEILDVDGRIGGFNFQWAWSSARVAARGLTARRSAGL